MRTVIVIPARQGSTRFPGKPLKLIQGRPMITWVIQAALSSKLADSVIVATDSLDIQTCAASFGVEVFLSSEPFATGSDRVCAAIQGKGYDCVVNLQGDEPLIQGHHLDALIEPLESYSMSTLVTRLKEIDIKDEHTVKVWPNQKHEALFFSRTLPKTDVDLLSSELVFKHIGVYAWRVDLLESFSNANVCTLEKVESLEQMRVLNMGEKIKCIFSPDNFLGVDVPSDIQRVEEFLENGKKTN